MVASGMSQIFCHAVDNVRKIRSALGVGNRRMDEKTFPAIEL